MTLNTKILIEVLPSIYIQEQILLKTLVELKSTRRTNGLVVQAESKKLKGDTDL